MNIRFSYLFFLFHDAYSRSLDAEKLCKYHCAICILLLCIHEASWYRTKLRTIKSAVCHGSTLSIVRHPL